MSGRVVLVTGAASGIGAAVAARFAADGDEVVGVDLVDDPADGVRRCDVTSTAEIAAVLGSLERLDVVANVAGIAQFGAVGSITDEEWSRVLDVDLTGPFKVCRAALPLLRAARGCIVNVASVAGLQGQPYTAAYSASKGGLVLLTKALAVELSVDGVRVNCVCPAAVDTPLLHGVAASLGEPGLDGGLLARLNGLLPGLATAEQVADAVWWLSSDAAAWVSGAALPIDGGRSA